MERRSSVMEELARHAIVPSRVWGEGAPALLRGRVSRCVTHFAPVSLPLRVREAFVAHRRTTMVPPAPCTSRRVGDPQVMRELWFVLRYTVRLFPFPMGWF